jgi:DNA-binding XRE family transcriptional regulator
VIIGDRLRDMREQKKLSQGDIEKRTGLLRCYISRVENGHTVSVRVLPSGNLPPDATCMFPLGSIIATGTSN